MKWLILAAVLVLAALAPHMLVPSAVQRALGDAVLQLPAVLVPKP